jgi:hypothetical protein
VFTGYAVINRPLDNSIELGFEAYNLQGGQYKLMFNRLVGKFCDSVYEPHLKEDTEKFFQRSNISITFGECPISPRAFTFNDFAPEGIGEFLPQYVPGNERWKLRIFLEENGKRTGSFDIYALLRNQQSMFSSTSSG